MALLRIFLAEISLIWCWIPNPDSNLEPNPEPNPDSNPDLNPEPNPVPNPEPNPDPNPDPDPNIDPDPCVSGSDLRFRIRTKISRSRILI